MAVKIEAEASLRLTSKVRARQDPTTVPPEFALTEVGERPEDGDWQTGAWMGTVTGVAPSLRATLVTPTIGGLDSDATVKVEPGGWDPWVRFWAGDEVIVWKLKRITISG